MSKHKNMGVKHIKPKDFPLFVQDKPEGADGESIWEMSYDEFIKDSKQRFDDRKPWAINHLIQGKTVHDVIGILEDGTLVVRPCTCLAQA